MKIVSMNGLTPEMVNILFEIQKVMYSLESDQKALLLETLRDNAIAALNGVPNAFVPIMVDK